MGADESYSQPVRRSSLHKRASPTQNIYPLPQAPLISLPPVMPNQGHPPFRRSSDPNLSSSLQRPKPQAKDQQITALTVNASICKKTISLVQIQNKPEHYLKFKFCSKCDCVITLHACVTEKFGPDNSIEFTSVKTAPPKQTFTFSTGNDQDFPPGLYLINLSECEKHGLSANGKYYPLAIRIDSIAAGSPEVPVSSHIIYAEFQKREGKYEIIVLKQKTIVGKAVYEIQETYGIEKAGDAGECVVCLTSKRDTMLLPCRHICICMECAEAMSAKANTCPICRSCNIKSE